MNAGNSISRALGEFEGMLCGNEQIIERSVQIKVDFNIIFSSSLKID